MAGTSLLALLDDIATVLDDVAVLTKVAGKKTAGVLGDDLALNAQQVAGVRADRELPVVWAVAKGSALNKVILVPAALAISALVPRLITPLLMFGGLFLCYEGCEKIAHKLFHGKERERAEHAELIRAVADPTVDLVAQEKKKIRGAIRTDFILSAEIVAISLGTVQELALTTQLGVLVAISALMTVGVYGLVGGIVKLDDAGTHLSKRGGLSRAFGAAILATAPFLMKFLTVAGTAAMFLVGGGILAHGLPGVEPWINEFSERELASVGMVGAILAALAPSFANAILGLVAGALALGVVSMVGAVVKSAKARG
jgi:predicted DNA repair protein MutK